MQQAQKGLSLSVRCLITFTSEGRFNRRAFAYMESLNNDKINQAWAAFSMSGKVEDYLDFAMLQNPPVSMEENLNADSNRGSHYQNKGHR